MTLDRQYGLFSIGIKQRMNHIETTNCTVNDIVRQYLEQRMKDYEQRFGEFERIDRNLWYNVDPARVRDQLLQEAYDPNGGE